MLNYVLSTQVEVTRGWWMLKSYTARVTKELVRSTGPVGTPTLRVPRPTPIGEKSQFWCSWSLWGPTPTVETRHTVPFVPSRD